MRIIALPGREERASDRNGNGKVVDVDEVMIYSNFCLNILGVSDPQRFTFSVFH